MSLRTPLLVVLGVLAAAAPVVASEPSSGKISNASPKVEWAGQITSSGVTYAAWGQDDTTACNAPACDTFALEVVDAGNITFTMNVDNQSAGGDPGCSFRLTMPDGSYQLHEGNCGPDTTMKYVLKNAPAGNYVVDVAESVVCCGPPVNYKASASLPTAGVVPAPSVAPTVPPAVAPAPAPGSAPTVTLSAKVATLSAKKLKKSKKFTATLKSSGALTGVNGFLVNKSRQLGSGKLASINGAAKLVVKLKRKLKPGSYQLTVGGKDAQGRNVAAIAKVKVKK